MLGYHTKQVTAYGKRRQRIVNVDQERLPKAPPSIFDDLPAPQWAPVVSRMKKRENRAKSPSPKILQMRKKRLSPVMSPVHKMRKMLPQIRRLEEGADVLTPERRPLGVRALNTPGSPAVGNQRRVASGGKGTPLLNKPFSPFVDILVLDDQGMTVSQERRVSGPQFGSDSEDDFPPQPKPARRLRKLVSTRVESDESDSDSDELAAPISLASSPLIFPAEDILPSSPRTGRQPRFQVEVVLPLRKVPAPAKPLLPLVVPPVNVPTVVSPPLRSNTPARANPPLRYQHFASPIPRPRALTPIGGRGRRMFAPVTPPSPLTPTDGDLTIDLSDLSVSFSPESERSSLADEIPEYLQPLLAECGQSKSGLHEFSAFIKSFPYDPLVCADARTALGFRKIGEASYSEVFGIGDVVLKVIPLREEAQRRLRPNQKTPEVEGPAETDAKDVLKEIIVTHAMGEVCDGFVKLLRAYVVKGTYPQVLLELWDEYYERKGSEGVRPDTFTVSQAYAIIVLPNGGPDLEAFMFKSGSKGGWKQACSVFWQVAKALAHAEQLVSFEHRDLHLGQILVKETAVASRALQDVNQNRKVAKAQKPLMDDAVHGVTATLIDLGLSRMDAGDGSGGEMVHWTPFEEEVFMGEGDYQFDIYRYMRDHNGDNWEAFNPLTNAMWLHYLAVKLLKSKGLKAPARRKSQAPAAASSGFTERDCYECLVDLEDWLGHCVAAVVAESKLKGKGRKKKAPAVVPAPAPLLLGPLCAGEVVAYGVKKGWVKSMA
ncbi:hypothetical protein DFH07DRAFT_904186 [Mycena maculata]|uniref:non-specific serine/threonine protein kinase n=1 Tax=Mycena maculata TaxID=230809 RepID=A0AAD7J0X8_9AGAR|nr:hypothetical protein DFH07DRAFT_904186 [Mycena maculata]